ncbi:MAG: zinc ribbon domain-containing protein [Muribaculaceae bacterium]|nr:zinc ribbon domain-containing protein [Muribaculaceae bacterium]
MPRYCYNCGFPLDDTQKFCDNCGKENAPSSPSTSSQPPIVEPQRKTSPAPAITPTTPIPPAPMSPNVPPTPPVANQQPLPYSPASPIRQQATIPPMGQPDKPAKKGGIHPAIIAIVVFIATIGIGLWAVWPEAPKTRTVNPKNTIGGKVVENAINAYFDDDSETDTTSGHSDDDIIKKIDKDLGVDVDDE